MKETVEKKQFDLNEIVEIINNIDPQNMGSLPVPVKITITVAVFLLVLLLGYFFDIASLQSRLSDAQEQQETLLKEFEEKAHQALNIDAYKTQLKEMETSFESLRRQLPQVVEQPGLVDDVTRAAMSAGVDLDTYNFDPKEEEKDGFYATNISVVLKGNYHAFGGFVSAVGALPRIVTLHDFTVSP